MNYIKKIKLSVLLINFIIWLSAILMVLPFWFMLVFSTHNEHSIFSVPPPFWFGDALGENLQQLLNRIPYLWHNISNSLYIALVTTILNLVFCSLAGSAFALYSFKGKNFLFSLVISTMLLPAFLNIIPNALIIAMFGWFNEPKALYIPAACSAFGIFLMRQYIEQAIPNEVIEAARLDGCSEWGLYRHIILPLIKPALFTLALLTFIASWNNFMAPLVVLHDMESYTLPLALRALQGVGVVPWGAICAGSAIAIIPLILLFIFTSHHLIDRLYK
ncbi:carbohydrate ABC transporter permease [Tolumonas lignilytica]|uniref:carbohydrate ABC transporter permease n=1 Tax=Tolumonas lignilytica TaxID=1283284 RepID=UPI000463F57D|nr:carbohydrate ABC transporter permease [Tolumonas lignilytica]